MKKKELDQVKTYMGVTLEEARFNTSNMSWTFFLIGKKISKTGGIHDELKSNAHHGEQSLVFKPEPNYKIYVKEWNEIFSEFECRHNFILEKLNFDASRIPKSFLEII